MLKYRIWQEVLLLAATYRNSLKECFFRYFLVKYFRYLFEKGMPAEMLTPFPSPATATSDPSWPVLPLTLIFCLRQSAKAVVLKTLSSTGLVQSMVNLWLIFFSLLPLVCLVDFMVQNINQIGNIFNQSCSIFNQIYLSPLSKSIADPELNITMESSEGSNFEGAESEEEVVEKVKKRPASKKEKKSRTQVSKENQSLDSNTQIISVTTAKGNINHERPEFLKRWDGECNSLEITEEQFRKMSPMMSVYWRQKSQFMKAVVFVQVGKMEYYVFENDAILFHQLFGKQMNKFSKFLSVHLWTSEVTQFTGKLYKKNIAMRFLEECYEDYHYKQKYGIIKRQIKRVINPGVHIDYESEEAEPSQRFLISIFPDDRKARIGVVVIDSETNTSYLEQIPYEDLRRVLNKFKPVQMVIPQGDTKQLKKLTKQVCNPYIVQIDYAPNSLEDVFSEMKINGSALFEDLSSLWRDQTKRQPEKFAFYHCLMALDVLSQYFKRLNVWDKIIPTSVFTLASLATLNIKPVFDAQVYENLEIFEIKNQEEGFGQKGTLYAYLNKCKTALGSRKLRQWINSPLTDVAKIKRRQQAIQEIIDNYAVLKKFHERLQDFPDFEVKIANVYHWLISNPKGFDLNIGRNKVYDQKNNPIIVKIKQIQLLLQKMQEVQKIIQSLFLKFNFQSEHLRQLINPSEKKKEDAMGQQFGMNRESTVSLPKGIMDVCNDILERFDETEDGNIRPQEGLIPQYDKELKILQSLYKKLDTILEQYKQKLGYKKIKFVSVRARNEIEIPKDYEVKKGDKWLHFSSFTSKVNRYTTLQAQGITEDIIEHEQVMDRAMIPFLNQLIKDFSKHKFMWSQFCETISELDVLCALAEVSNSMEIRCAPEFINEGLAYEDGVHVGLEQMGKKVIRNSVKFAQRETAMIITGPNMGGKSTILRQTCILAIIAQIGCHVPARSYKGKTFDQIFCRIGASDRIHEGKSTFFVQLQQTKHILEKATKDSLVVIDELGRGTSTFDGVSIAVGTLHHLVQKICCITLFSTHYSIIADEFELCKKVRNKTVDYQIQGDRLEFRYQLVDGVAERSFALNVARLVGIPEFVLNKAHEKSEMITKEDQSLRHLQELTKKFNDLLILAEKQSKK